LNPADIKKGWWYIVAGQGPLLCNEAPDLSRLVDRTDKYGLHVAAVPAELLGVGFTTARYYQEEFHCPPPSNYWASAGLVVRVVDRGYLEAVIAQAILRLGADAGIVLLSRAALVWLDGGGAV